MPDLKISEAADPVTLVATDKVPLARLSSPTPYAATMTEIATWTKAGLLPNTGGTINGDLKVNGIVTTGTVTAGPSGELRLLTGDQTSVASETVSMGSGDITTGSSWSGTVTIYSGPVVDGTSGTVNVRTGETYGTGGGSGSLYLLSGNIESGVGKTGEVYIGSGIINGGAGSSGRIRLTTADAKGAGQHVGGIEITTGYASSGAGKGEIYLASEGGIRFSTPTVTVDSPSVTFNGSATATGNMTVTGEVHTNYVVNSPGDALYLLSNNQASGPSQEVYLLSGDVTGAAAQSGTVYMLSGNATGTSGGSGFLNIESGSSSTGYTGTVNIRSGHITGTGVSTGDLSLCTGTAIGGNSGRIIMNTGAAKGAGRSVGDIEIQTGAAESGAAEGSIVVSAQNINFHGSVMIDGPLTVGGTSGPTWTVGTGLPAATQPRGSLFSRTDGAVGSTLYVSRGAGTWNAVAGV